MLASTEVEVVMPGGTSPPHSGSISLLEIAVLIDELRHEEIAVRLNAISKLPEISESLGPQRTRDELLPYLNEFIDDEDEVLLMLAEELGKLLSYVGGPDHGSCLLLALEAFCAVEEPTVRDKAIESLCNIVKRMSTDHVVAYAFPLIQRLSAAVWFTSRIAACNLFAVTYPLVPSHIQIQLISLFTQLCSDPTPMVRRVACNNIGPFVAVLESEFLLSDIIPTFVQLAHDQQDSVRLLTVDAAVHIAGKISLEDTVQHILPLVRAACDDKSWRVRYMATQKYTELCSIVKDASGILESMIEAFVKLLKDPESEVRAAAAHRVTEFSSLIPPNLTVIKIIPAMNDLVNDSCQYTRTALASVIMEMASLLPKEEVSEHLLPLFLMLLRDGQPDVRLNIISKIDTVNQVVGVEALSQSLLPAIMELAMDRKWRVRLATIKHIPLLASQLGVHFFDQNLSQLCMEWLGDQVFSIRDAATDNLSFLTEIFGVDWAHLHIIPRVLQLLNHSNYLFRMTSLHAIRVLSVKFGHENTKNLLLPLVISLKDDPVPNIRFNVIKTLRIMMNFVDNDTASNQIRPIIDSFASDSDTDVIFFAEKAIQDNNRNLEQKT